MTALVGVWLIASLVSGLWETRNADGFEVAGFAKLPVAYGGRFKPIDTVARNSLTILTGTQSVSRPAGRLDASAWLLEALATPDQAAGHPLFRIDHPQVRELAGLDAVAIADDDDDKNNKRVSYQALAPARGRIYATAQQIQQNNPPRKTPFQNELIELAEHLSIYESLISHQTLGMIPSPKKAAASTEQAGWLPLAQALQTANSHPTGTGIQDHYMAMYRAYGAGDPAVFNAQLTDLSAQLAASGPAISRKAVIEWHFNRFAPFAKAKVLYLAAGLLVLLSWLGLSPATLRQVAIRLVMLALIVHTAALAVRVGLSGRAPVTNLYTSAVFIGWGGVILSLFLERLLQHGLGLIVGAVLGFATLLIAQGLSADGDTMAVLQAVLDTNFWLWTHVTVITLGYVATFIAGGLGILYILAGIFTTALDREMSKKLGQAIYGTICFGVLLSFIGTILGGIWADQSWGRFWGWDPKENGALMIVLWNAIILHARFGGMIRQRGMAVMAVMGNIVTAWSWFGVNMLGAGLHSYGFIDSALFWLLAFVASQAALVALGTMPLEAWRSHQAHFTPPRPPEVLPRAAG